MNAPVTFVIGAGGLRHRADRGGKLDVYDNARKDVFSLADARARTDVQLPPGRYRVVAQAGGIERSKQVALKPGSARQVSLHWPKSAAKA